MSILRSRSHHSHTVDSAPNAVWSIRTVVELPRFVFGLFRSGPESESQLNLTPVSEEETGVDNRDSTADSSPNQGGGCQRSFLIPLLDTSWELSTAAGQGIVLGPTNIKIFGARRTVRRCQVGDFPRLVGMLHYGQCRIGNGVGVRSVSDANLRSTADSNRSAGRLATIRDSSPHLRVSEVLEFRL